ncbi:hypothetical protein Tco_0516425 [Tanacetum coccineum]
MAATKAIEYAPQYGDLTLESVTFQSNNCGEIETTHKVPQPKKKFANLNPPANIFEARPLKEYIIKFTVMNGEKLLILDFKTFCEATSLDYNKGTYVFHPSFEDVKAKMAKIK